MLKIIVQNWKFNQYGRNNAPKLHKLLNRQKNRFCLCKNIFVHKILDGERFKTKSFPDIQNYEITSRKKHIALGQVALTSRYSYIFD